MRDPRGLRFKHVLEAVLSGIGLIASTATVAADEPSAISLPGDRAFPESITSTPDGTVYVGSLGSGAIFRAKPRAGDAEVWIQPGTSGGASIFGVLADARSSTLWACSNDLSAMGITIQGAAPGSWLESFDLRTGETKVRVQLPGEHALCNDIAISRDGSVFVTNSLTPEILKLSADRTRLDVWATDPQFATSEDEAGLDGIAFGEDGNLYVDTYTRAELFRVDVANGKAGRVTKLSVPRALVLADALRLVSGTTFLLIEGGGRLDRVVVDGNFAMVETLKDDLELPTGVTRVGRDIAFVSEGQLSVIFDPARKDEKPKLPFRAYPVKLSR